MDYFTKRLQPLAPAEKFPEQKDSGTSDECEPVFPADLEEASCAQKRVNLKKPSSRRQEAAEDEQNRLAHILGWRAQTKRVADRHNPKL